MTRSPEKMIRDGKVAVLISPQYGAGWSSWSMDSAEVLLFDKRLVEMAEAGSSQKEVEAYLNGIGVEAYCGGWGDITVVWLDPGERFYIDEYDGRESLRTVDEHAYVA